MAVAKLIHPAGLELEERHATGIALLRVRGELDLSTAPALCHAIQSATARAARRRIAIDLRSVGFCDSTGLRALMGAAQEVEAQAGAVTIIVAEGSSVDRTLTLAGVREFLHVARSLGDARHVLAVN